MRVTSCASRVLPTPGSPESRRSRPAPCRTMSTSSRVRAISRARATSGLSGAAPRKPPTGRSSKRKTSSTGRCRLGTDASRAERSVSVSPSPSARSRMVARWGRSLTPRSRSEMARTLRPARSASASWVSSAASRYRRSRPAKDASGGGLPEVTSVFWMSSLPLVCHPRLRHSRSIESSTCAGVRVCGRVDYAWSKRRQGRRLYLGTAKPTFQKINERRDFEAKIQRLRFSTDDIRRRNEGKMSCHDT
jgi:hypothetical protein